jgi:hypothetical protein
LLFSLAETIPPSQLLNAQTINLPKPTCRGFQSSCAIDSARL